MPMSDYNYTEPVRAPKYQKRNAENMVRKIRSLEMFVVIIHYAFVREKRNKITKTSNILV